MNKLLRLARRLARDENGASMVEFAIVAMLLVILTFAILEFALISWQWASAEASVQVAARYAVESDPVASGFSDYNGVDAGLPPGQVLDFATVPAFSVTCTSAADGVPHPPPATPGAVTVSCACASGSCGVLPNLDGDADAYWRIFQRARLLFPRVQPKNLAVDYAHVGLGFAGRPGPDIVPAVTVRLVDQKHPVAILDAFGVSPELTLPNFATTLSGEDLATGF